MNISVETWIEILCLLDRHNIPYTTHYESRDESNIIYDKHIQINLVIPDYFGDCK